MKKLMKMVERRISDRRVLKLIRNWLKAGVIEDVQFHETKKDSPLLANLYLHYLDTIWEKKFAHLGTLIQYADDLVVICKRKREAIEGARVLQAIMQKLDLNLNKEKSRLVSIWDEANGFDFLGFRHRKFRQQLKGGSSIHAMTHVLSKKAMKQMRQKIKEYTEPRNKLYWRMDDLVQGLNRRLQGFRNYYHISKKTKKWLSRIDWYVLERLTLFCNKKRNKRKKHSRLWDVQKMTRGKLVKLAC
jgi:hypothetical protein